MKRRWAVVCFLILAGTPLARSSAYVRDYVRRDGTYVGPHYRSAPDGSFYNNWSTYPNVNPYTGQIGTRRYPRTYTPRYRTYVPKVPSYRTYQTPSFTVPRYPSTPPLTGWRATFVSRPENHQRQRVERRKRRKSPTVGTFTAAPDARPRRISMQYPLTIEPTKPPPKRSVSPALEAGDTVRVIRGPAHLKDGTEVLAVVESYHPRMIVEEIRGNWVKVTVHRTQVSITGWLHRVNVARTTGAGTF